MKVAVFPSDDGGCGWYRLRWPAQALAAQGHDVVIDPPEPSTHQARPQPVRNHTEPTGPSSMAAVTERTITNG